MKLWQIFLCFVCFGFFGYVSLANAGDELFVSPDGGQAAESEDGSPQLFNTDDGGGSDFVDFTPSTNSSKSKGNNRGEDSKAWRQLDDVSKKNREADTKLAMDEKTAIDQKVAKDQAVRSAKKAEERAKQKANKSNGSSDGVEAQAVEEENKPIKRNNKKKKQQDNTSERVFNLPN